MSDKISIETIPNIPYIAYGADIAQLIAETSESSELEDGDILYIASKAVSTA